MARTRRRGFEPGWLHQIALNQTTGGAGLVGFVCLGANDAVLVGGAAGGREIRTVEIDPERGPFVVWAFKTHAVGEWTIRTLHAEVTKRGLLSAR